MAGSDEPKEGTIHVVDALLAAMHREADEAKKRTGQLIRMDAEREQCQAGVAEPVQVGKKRSRRSSRRRSRKRTANAAA